MTTEEEEILIEELYDTSINKDIVRSEKWLMEELNKYIIKTEEYIENQVKVAKNHLMEN